MIFLEHVGICAKNTIALKDWYTNLFGFKIQYNNHKDSPTFLLLMDNECLLEIYPMVDSLDKRDNKCQGIRHLAFGTDNIEKEYNKLLESNVEIIEELKVNPKGVKTVFFKDLEDNIIHFVQRSKKL